MTKKVYNGEILYTNALKEDPEDGLITLDNVTMLSTLLAVVFSSVIDIHTLSVLLVI